MKNCRTISSVFSASGFTYDASGNMTSDGINGFAWNAESENKTANSTTYTYDGDGNRVEKSDGKIYWYGAGTEILDESDLSGNITDEYVFFGGKRVAHRSVSANSIYYYMEDFLGTSRILTTSSGSVCYEADFYPYGGERVITNTCPQNYKFEGKERDTETGVDDFGARYYTSRLGRWLSPDWSSTPAPVPYADLTNPQTLNLYAMVHDNPETFADLDGHDPSVPLESPLPSGTLVDPEQEQEVQNLDDKALDTPQVKAAAVETETTMEEVNRVVQPLIESAEGAVGNAATGLLSAVVDVLSVPIAILVTPVSTSSSDTTDAHPCNCKKESADEKSAEKKEVEPKGKGAGKGVRKGKKDRSLQGTIDQLEGVEQYQKDMTKKGGSKEGGYRPGAEKSKQDLKKNLKDIKSGQDVDSE